jgi:hypothetical protein
MDQYDEQDPFTGLENWAKDTERRVRRERRLGGLRRNALVLAGAALAVALLAVLVPVVRSWLPSGTSASAGDDDAAAYPTQSVPAGISVTSTASAVPTDPFAGTAAAAYPKGAAGITLPRATAVTGFTAAQVDAALRQVRAALVGGRLERAMLVGHKPDEFLALLAPNQRDDIGKWFRSTSFDTVATWIDPAVKLDSHEQPRVSGRVTYTAKRINGIQTLQVTTNFVWVYAFEGADHPLAVEHDENRWEFPSPSHLRAGDKGMWIADTRAYSAWVDCAAAAKGMLAPTRPGAGATPGPQDTEDPDAYLKTDHSLDIADDCPRPPPSSH